MNKDVIEIISKRSTSILFQHDDYLFSSYLVDQLMAFCDELEAGLVQAQTDGGKLMEAVVHHMLAG
jgi:hypothetical protein